MWIRTRQEKRHHMENISLALEMQADNQSDIVIFSSSLTAEIHHSTTPSSLGSGGKTRLESQTRLQSSTSVMLALQQHRDPARVTRLPPVATDAHCTSGTVEAEASGAPTRTSRNHKQQTSSRTMTNRSAHLCFPIYSTLVLSLI